MLRLLYGKRVFTRSLIKAKTCYNIVIYACPLLFRQNLIYHLLTAL